MEYLNIILNDFIKEILLFEKVLINEFGIKNLIQRPPREFRNANLDGYDYIFHGAGATFYFNGIKYNFDMDVFDDELKGNKDYYFTFSSDDIWDYINSNNKYKGLYKSKVEVNEELERLKENGRLQNLIVGNKIYNSYVLSKEWYNTLIAVFNS